MTLLRLLGAALLLGAILALPDVGEPGIVCVEIDRVEVRIVQEEPQRITELDVYEWCRADYTRNYWLRVGRQWVTAPSGRAPIGDTIIVWDSFWGACKAP